MLPIACKTALASAAKLASRAAVAIAGLCFLSACRNADEPALVENTSIPSAAPAGPSASAGSAALSARHPEADVRALVSTEGGTWPTGVTGAIWSPAGDFLLVSDAHGVTLIQTKGWRVARRLSSSYSLLGYYAGKAISSETQRIAVGRLNGIDLWTQDLQRPVGHLPSFGTFPLAFTSGGRQLVGRWNDGKGGEIRVLDVASGRVVHRVRRSDKMLGDLVVEARGRLAATLHRAVSLWKLPDMTLVWKQNVETSPSGGQFGWEGRTLLTTHESGDVIQWDVETGTHRLSRCCFVGATSAHPWLVLASASEFQVLSASDHRVMHTQPRLDARVPHDLKLGPSGFLAEVSLDGQLHVWKLSTAGQLSLVAGDSRKPSTSRTEP